MFKPTLSIITLVYNNVRDIEQTIRSVLNQSYPNIEYIVIDGASTDGTLAIIKQYEPRITKLVSEKDQGIYDAMNKGLSLATGDYILFMNSGDTLYTNDTVAKVFATQPHADIYYGETEVYSDDWKKLGIRRHQTPEHFTWRGFKYGMNIGHQAIYIKRSLTQPYDLSYQLSSDIDWIIRAAKKANTIVNTHQLVAKFREGGLSKKKHFRSLKERFWIFAKHYGFIPTLLNHLVIGLRRGLNLIGYKQN